MLLEVVLELSKHVLFNCNFTFRFVIDELIDTEKIYVTDLAMVVEVGFIFI